MSTKPTHPPSPFADVIYGWSLRRAERDSYLKHGEEAGRERVKIAPRLGMQFWNAYAHSGLANGHFAPKNLGAQKGKNTEEQE